jgi:crotonobetainyl-CoA:carnitine CoA-transferase CaiB-like acyl-CoA transferase
METTLFEDLVVLDCASFIAGPAAATIMADFGARVVKIEPPGIGDSLRQVRHTPGFPLCDQDYFWLLDNRSKQGLALDLKHEDGQRVLREMVARADVFITNFPAPIRERLRLTADDLTPLNPRLIYASLTPYGEQGPERDSTGYDATAWWARSGLMDAVRASPDHPPASSVPGMGDHPTSVALFGAIMAALYRRERTGKGGHVSTSLLANGLWSFGSFMQAHLCEAEFKPRPPRGQRGALAEFYRCRDGRWFLLAILNQAREWPLLLQALGDPD